MPFVDRHPVRRASALIAGVIVALSALLWGATRENAVLLVDRAGSEWIRHDEPVELQLRHRAPSTTFFRARIRLQRAEEGCALMVRGLKATRFLVDGSARGVGIGITPTVEEGRRWREPVRLPLGDLTAGAEHEI